MRLPPESSERELMTPIPANVHVTLRGATRALDQLIQSGVPPIEVDLRQGNRDVLVFSDKMLSLPRDVDVAIIDSAEYSPRVAERHLSSHSPSGIDHGYPSRRLWRQG
ncbi:MAG: hypothetical protein QM784_20560 [Polyangiaceae bacterium]